MSGPLASKRQEGAEGAKAPLRRWPKTDDGLSRYRHPNRYVIYQEKRDWNLDGITRGAQHQWSPMYWWTVKPLFGPRPASKREFDTLREARAWCDEHPPPEPVLSDAGPSTATPQPEPQGGGRKPNRSSRRH